MVFNKDGKMIAAQWEALSAAWIEIGEVSGKGDGGNINGVIFDHVFPVEMETPNGVMTLNLGYNNLENPFDAAQRFIDDNSLGQNYLRQISDYIVSRAGNNVPTLGETSNQTSTAPKSYETIPVRFVAVHDEIPPLNKLVTKLLQFNTEQSSSEIALSEANIESINSLVSILEDTSHYHSSTITTNMLLPIFKISEWDIQMAFPAMDLARLFAFHPSGAAVLAKNNKLKIFLTHSIRFLSQGIDKSSSATVLTTLRFIINTFKHEILRKEIMNNEILISILSSLEYQYNNSNSKIRVAISTLCMNISASFNQLQENKHDLSTLLFKIIYNQLNIEIESEDVILRSVSTIGTIYLVGDESIRNILKTNSIFSSKSMEVTLNDISTKWGTKLNSTTSKCIKEVLDLIKN
jgi:phospholipase A-2-activating protein